MVHKLIQQKDCLYRFQLEFPKDEVNQEIENIAKNIQSEANVSGFRKGCAPITIIKQIFNETIAKKVRDNLISKELSIILDKQKIKLVTEPVVEDKPVKFDEDYSVEIFLEKIPEIVFKKYKNFKLKGKKTIVDEKQIEDYINQLRQQNAYLVPSLKIKVDNQHFVTLSYEIFVDGELVDRNENFLLDMTSPVSIMNLKENILGKQEGMEFQFEINFPEEHPDKKLQGKSAIMKVKILALKERKLPNIDDNFAKDLGCEDITKLREAVREILEKNLKQELYNDLRQQIFDNLLKEHKFPVPISETNRYLQEMIDDIYQDYKKRGGDEKSWKENLEKLKAKYLPIAEERVRLAYILFEIAKKENIKVDEDDFIKEREILLKLNPKNESTIKKYFEENEYTIKARILENKVVDFLINSSEITN